MAKVRWMDKEYTLDLCPFCGSNDLAMIFPGGSCYNVCISCNNCGATGPPCLVEEANNEDTSLVARMWNERKRIPR